MQERFDALLAELGLLPRRAFTLAQLLDRIAATRGRPIELVPFSVNDPDAPSGAWVPYPDVDLIFHKATTPPHRAHIVLHETGHMLCGHTARSDALPLFLAQCSPAGHDPQPARHPGRPGLAWRPVPGQLSVPRLGRPSPRRTASPRC